jgi:hypothetical protein
LVEGEYFCFLGLFEVEKIFGSAVGLVLEQGLVADEVVDPGVQCLNLTFLLRLEGQIFSLQRRQKLLSVFDLLSSPHKLLFELAYLFLEVKLVAIHHLHYPCYLAIGLFFLMPQSINHHFHLLSSTI